MPLVHLWLAVRSRERREGRPTLDISVALGLLAALREPSHALHIPRRQRPFLPGCCRYICASDRTSTAAHVDKMRRSANIWKPRIGGIHSAGPSKRARAWRSSRCASRDLQSRAAGKLVVPCQEINNTKNLIVFGYCNSLLRGSSKRCTWRHQHETQLWQENKSINLEYRTCDVLSGMPTLPQEQVKYERGEPWGT